MESASKRSAPASRAQATVTLPPAAAEHLDAALEQMDLLLATRQIDAGLCYLVDLLHNLRALRVCLRAANAADDASGAAKHRATTDSVEG